MPSFSIHPRPGGTALCACCCVVVTVKGVTLEFVAQPTIASAAAHPKMPTSRERLYIRNQPLVNGVASGSLAGKAAPFRERESLPCGHAERFRRRKLALASSE